MIFDGHCDIWTDITSRRCEYGEDDVFRRRHLDKFHQGGVGGGIFVIWNDPPFDADPVKRSAQVVKSLKAELEQASDILNPVTSFDDFQKGDEAGKINVVTGMEGMAQIGTDVDLLNYFYEEAGARHGMLTWNEKNDLASGWKQDPEGGLTEAGKKAVQRMDELGMVVDVSHLNDKSFWGVIDAASGPVIASHSNCRALCGTMRNLSDDMIRAIGKTGGLVGMNSFKEFTSLTAGEQDTAHLALHAAHVAELIGAEHVGLGFDFDDYLEGDSLATFSDNVDSPSVEGMENEAEASNMLAELKKVGFSDEEVEGIAYRNFFRVFQQVWK